jgi:hypothetical protein
MILVSDAPKYPEYNNFPVFRPFLRGSDGTMSVPIRFDRTFHKSLFMKNEEEKNPACPHGATVLILLVTVTYSPAPILQAPN